MTDSKSPMTMLIRAKRAAEFIRFEMSILELLDSRTGCQFIIEDCPLALNEAKIDVGLSGKTFDQFSNLINEHLDTMDYPASELAEKIVKVIKAATYENQTRFFAMWREFFPT